MDQLPNDFLSSENELQISGETSGYLIETSKWAKFIAITFYILTGLALLVTLVWGSYVFNTLSSYRRSAGDELTIAVVALILVAVVVGVTWYFLLSFANKMRVGIETENIEQVNSGLNALKIHFIIVGILLTLGLLASVYSLSRF